ncbi:hypothetical protein BC940DRAFT_309231 [Gongronella butleri]|nr:hypothetical protein BC940DRAFT_309231 [Gongronella butleri]
MDITQLRPSDLSLAKTKPPLVAASPTVSIESALTLMSSHKFTSLPLFSHNSATVVSIVNLFDILLYLVAKQTTIEKAKFPLADPIENVLGLDSDRESYRLHKTDQQDTLLDTLRYFANGGHRSLVVDAMDESKHPWLLSQTDIIRHMARNPDCVQSAIDLNASVDKVGLLKEGHLIKAVIGKDVTAVDVFRKMAAENLSGIPVLDDQGQFVGDLCLEDVPMANLEKVQLLNLPALDYLKTAIHRQAIVAQRDATVKEILGLMVEKDTHRVWIIESGKVIGVVTMSDVIGAVCAKHPATVAVFK